MLTAILLSTCLFLVSAGYFLLVLPAAYWAAKYEAAKSARGGPIIDPDNYWEWLRAVYRS